LPFRRVALPATDGQFGRLHKVAWSRGLAYIKLTENGIDLRLKSFSETISKKIAKRPVQSGDNVLLFRHVAKDLHNARTLRLEMAKRLNLIDENKWNLLWWSISHVRIFEKRNAMWPCTSVHFAETEDVPMLDTDLSKVRARHTSD